MSADSMAAYLRSIGVPDLPRACSAFDPGYDPGTVEGHLAQSGHLLASLKLSMACWQIADPAATARKVAAAKSAGVPVLTGGGPFEVAVAAGQLDAYLDLCADLGANRIEAGEGFTDMRLAPTDVVQRAARRGLAVQFELGKKHEGAFTTDRVAALVDQGQAWLDAGAVHLVVEARESAQSVGIFDEHGQLDHAAADRLVAAFGFERLTFEAPDKRSQFLLLDYLGPRAELGNIRLEEILRVEIYRRGLHSDAYGKPGLTPVPGLAPVPAPG
jgi:phosphosulfolactate synthase